MNRPTLWYGGSPVRCCKWWCLRWAKAVIRNSAYCLKHVPQAERMKAAASTEEKCNE
jgi:hypothetical protein